MEWVKKPQIACETDRTWNSAVRGGGRTGVTYYDRGQEHERPEFVKTRLSQYDLTGTHNEIRVSSNAVHMHPLQEVPTGHDESSREGDKLVGLHVETKVRVRYRGYRAAEYNIYAAIGGWSEGVNWQRQSIFAAVIRDRQGGIGQVGSGSIIPEHAVEISTAMDDGLRPLAQRGLGAYASGFEVVAYDSWTPTKPANRRQKTRWVMTTEFGPLPVPTESEIITTNIEESAWWEEEEHEFFFSIDLESNLDYLHDVPEKDGLYVVLWAGSQHHPQGPVEVIATILQGQTVFTWEEVMTNGQRARALRDRILNTQRETGIYGTQTHKEQMREEEMDRRLDNPMNPDLQEDYQARVEEHRGLRRERDELADQEDERPQSFRRTGGPNDEED